VSASAAGSEASAGLTCPSSTCQPGAVLLGVVGRDGRVRYVSPALAVDDEFVEQAQRGRTPEKRFRFAGPCVEDRCAQWTGRSCGVIERVLSHPGVDEAVAAHDGPAPPCAIRRHCRWFAQEGVAACHACPLVVTDTAHSSSRRKTVTHSESLPR
jgi:hypothetical protein